MPPKLKECKNPECKNTFLLYNSLKPYCSTKCEKACKKRTPLKKVSEKRKKENILYSELRIDFLSLPENQICPITGQPTTDIHHKKGRIGKLLTDTNYWIALSREGHEFVESNPEWAYENGYSLKRNQK